MTFVARLLAFVQRRSFVRPVACGNMNELRASSPEQFTSFKSSSAPSFKTPPFQVTFTNSKTKEYMYFELSLHFKSPQVVEAAIQLHTIVRQPVQKTICISNPLNSTVQFLATSDLLEHIEFPALLQIHPFSEVFCPSHLAMGFHFLSFFSFCPIMKCCDFNDT